MKSKEGLKRRKEKGDIILFEIFEGKEMKRTNYRQETLEGSCSIKCSSQGVL